MGRSGDGAPRARSRRAPRVQHAVQATRWTASMPRVPGASVTDVSTQAAGSVSTVVSQPLNASNVVGVGKLRMLEGGSCAASEGPTARATLSGS